MKKTVLQFIDYESLEDFAHRLGGYVQSKHGQDGLIDMVNGNTEKYILEYQNAYSLFINRFQTEPLFRQLINQKLERIDLQNKEKVLSIVEPLVASY